MSGHILVRAECITIFEAVLVEGSRIQLQWNNVSTSTSECPENPRYIVSHRCCSDANWNPTSTANILMEFQLDEKSCANKLAVFSIRVEGSNTYRYVTVNLQNKTGT